MPAPPPNPTAVIDFAAVSAIFLAIIGVLPMIITTVATLMAIGWYTILYREHRANRLAVSAAEAVLAAARVEAARVLAEAQVQAAKIASVAQGQTNKVAVKVAEVAADAQMKNSGATAALAVAIAGALPIMEGQKHE